MEKRLKRVAFAFAFAFAFACAFVCACAPAVAPVAGGLRADGLRLTVGQPASFVLEGSPSGRVFTKGTTMFVVSANEIRSPRETDGSSVLVFRMKGDNKVVGGGKTGTFDATNDTLTFDNGMSITIRDGVPYVTTAEATTPLVMKFESLPTTSKRAALLIALLILAVAEHR